MTHTFFIAAHLYCALATHVIFEAVLIFFKKNYILTQQFYMLLGSRKQVNIAVAGIDFSGPGEKHNKWAPLLVGVRE
jgi:hypothetical protein